VPNGLAQVVECFKLHARGVGINILSWLPLLHASLDVPTKLGTVISIDGFALGTISKIQEVPKIFLARFSLGKEKKERRT
jgi:hypothetical protein